MLQNLKEMNIYEQIHEIYGLSATQQEILKLVGEEKIVLEVGSSTGYMTRIFLQNKCIVDVVEKDKKAIVKLPKSTRLVLNYSIEDDRVKKLLSKDYDFIILADVLEHLVDPKKALDILFSIANQETKLLISMPNIASWTVRKQLFFRGDFEYQETGILDKTHLHFYTVNTLPKLLKQSGWKVNKLIGTIIRLPLEGSIDKIPIINRVYQQFIRQNLVEKFKNLSYYHFLVVATKL